MKQFNQLMQHCKKILIGIIILTFSMSAINKVHAQDMLNNTPDYVGAWYLGHIMRHRGKTGKGTRTKTKPKKRTPSKAEQKASAERHKRATLAKQAVYTPSKWWTNSVNTSFADFLSGKRDAKAPELLRALAMDNSAKSKFVHLLAATVGKDRNTILHQLKTGPLQRDYGKWLASMGYSDKNLLDVHTAFLMHAWAIANNGVITKDYKAAFTSIRNHLLDVQMDLEKSPLAERTNNQKHEEAQSFALFTALLVSAWQENKSDKDDKAVLINGTNALGRRIGIDFKKVNLTKDGFSPR